MRMPGLGMRSLLERAGFRIRTATRADCGRCSGRSTGTVSYTAEVAHCFRCDWRASTVTLARELGLLNADPATLARLREETRGRARFNVPIQAFEAWRDAQIHRLSDRILTLSRAAVQAGEVLRTDPANETAWETLSKYYHSQAQLSAAFDFLKFAKASDWLETDSTPVEVLENWRRDAA